MEDVDPPAPVHQPGAASASASLPAGESLGQAGASFGQARTIEMVFRAKLRRLEFETKQGRRIAAEVVRRRIAEDVRALRDGLFLERRIPWSRTTQELHARKTGQRALVCLD